MDTLQRARQSLKDLLQKRAVDPSLAISVNPLSPDQAIGKDADPGFVLKKGLERVIEATFAGKKGQAFTDRPSTWAGTLDQLLNLDLRQIPKRAVFVAGLNAVLCERGMLSSPLHCRDQDPSRCGPEMAGTLHARFGRVRVGMVGLQPAILEGLASLYGTDWVRVVDLNPENVGRVRSGVPVWDGDTELPGLVVWCEVGLATGSSIVNGTLDEIKMRFEKARKPLVLYGNTISGVAALLGLDHLCPFGRPG